MALPLSGKNNINIGLVLLVLCFGLWCTIGSCSCSCSSQDLIQLEYLKVPASEFVSSLKSTIDIVSKVTSIVSTFSNLFGDSRLTHAVSDCLDLLDLSVDELSWTLSASQNPNNKGKYNSSGNVSKDLLTWLSGALVNQDTCMEGFEGASNTLVKSLMEGGLDQITTLVRQILSMVNDGPTKPKKGGTISHAPTPTPGPGRKLRSNVIDNNKLDHLNFPYWIKPQVKRLLLQAPGGVFADFVVAADGTGNFTTITEAIEAVPDHSTRRFVIYVKRGIYQEYILITKKKPNIMMIGDGIDATVITGNHSFMGQYTTYASATFAVKGQGFIARDLTIENTAGPQMHQAVAYRSDSDLSVLFRCAFKGYQDTLYAHSLRQFYRDCKITGTVDFIFGDGTVVFQNCQILARKGLPNQKNTITAQGRKEPTEPTGFSIQFCNISVEADVIATQPNSSQIQTYLGRPWKLYSRTVIMQSYISNAIRPQGWLEWNGDFALDTLYYGEYLNYGPGSGLGNRVKWPGYHTINDSAVANSFTVAEFILGNSWLPSTGVKYTAGLGV